MPNPGCGVAGHRVVGRGVVGHAFIGHAFVGPVVLWTLDNVDSGRRSHDFLLIEVAVSKDFLAFFYSINPTHMAKLTD